VTAPVNAAATTREAPVAQASQQLLYRYSLHLGDTSLILAQRLGEWVGHAPALEEDLALANIGLDLIGQARYLLSYAAELEGKGRTEDDLAFLRDPADFTNLGLVEQPNVDFGHTIVRQFLIDAWQLELFEHLQQSAVAKLAELAAKALKETRYHLRFSSGWMVRLGDGTAESHRRVQDSLESLWKFTHELFVPSELEQQAATAGIAPELGKLRPSWMAQVDAVLHEATLVKPADVPYAWHGKNAQHSEHLSRLLAEMQIMQRTYPGAQW
jgi:ring-1,2-phenylacetyl-CoA epoxidase subunit PaaC